MQKLASVVRVSAVTPLANADRIELAHVAGWRCVIKRGELNAGDLAVYLEIDAVPPDSDVFAWLWQLKNSPERVARPASFRIRTMQLRRTLSQGLLMPLDSVGVLGANEGDDLTAKLGVTRYEPPAPAGMGEYRGSFPSVISKTDEMRIQSMPELLNELRGRPFVAMVKMDGTSASFVMVDGELHVCGRNFSIRECENLDWFVAHKYRLAEVLGAHAHLAMQGEAVGPGIQKNPARLAEKDLFVFQHLRHSRRAAAG